MLTPELEQLNEVNRRMREWQPPRNVVYKDVRRDEYGRILGVVEQHVRHPGDGAQALQPWPGRPSNQPGGVAA